MLHRDTGLETLAYLTRWFGLPADEKQLVRAYAMTRDTVPSEILLRAASDLGLKARLLKDIREDELFKMPMPLLMHTKEGAWLAALGANQEMGRIALIDVRLGFRRIDAEAAKLFVDWDGTVILTTRRFTMEKKSVKFGLMWFWPVLRKYVRFFLNVLFLSLVLQLLGLAAPLFTQTIIDKVLVHRSVDTLDILVAGMAISSLFTHWMEALRGYLFGNVVCKIDAVLGSRIFRDVLHLPRQFLDKWQTGEIVSRMGELGVLRNFLTGSSMTVLLDVVFACVYFGVLLLYSKLLSIVVLVVLVLFAILNIVAAPLYRRYINERFLIGAESQSFLIETITGIRTIKSSAVETLFMRRYEEILARYVRAAFSVLQIANITSCIGSFLQHTFSLLILWIGALQVMDNKLTVGELIAFQMIAGQLISPLMRLVETWQKFQQVQVSLTRLGDIMDEKKEAMFNPNRTTLPHIKGRIVFDGVSFGYRKDAARVLQNVDLSIPEGARVGIVGASGSGKSTLTRLLQRLYLPDTGRILVDGVDIAQVEPNWLRRQIGVVLQENMLFSGTVEENISIACPHASREEVLRAAALAGVTDFIEELPQGYDTFVGERGTLLSGGQRQRIAIARALLTNPSILIFDEATSALDSTSEQLIMQNFSNISRGRTVLMIAHRLSTVRNCDVIFVLDKGCIAEAGTHEALMAKHGIYWQLHMSQRKEL